jgi:5-(carboxyamino)imidazole ribonucleotide synthase
VLCVEYFVERGRLVANEMAPRVHNSGHWTIEGAETSQFENHVRAIAGLPLGGTRARGHAVMVNVIGRKAAAAKLLRVPGTHWHDYGKAPRARRKLGHVTIVAATRDARDRATRQLRRGLNP